MSKRFDVKRKAIIGSVVITSLFVVFAFLLLELEPNTHQTHAITSADAREVLEVIERYKTKLEKNPDKVSLHITEQELNGLFKLAKKAKSNINTSIAIDTSKAKLRSALTLSTPIPLYLNFSAEVTTTAPASARGIHWKKVTIGKLRLPPNVANWIAEIAFAKIVGKQKASAILDGIKFVEIDTNTITFIYSPNFKFSDGITAISETFNQASGLKQKIDEARVEHYYRYYTNTYSNTQRIELHVTMSHLIIEAFNQSHAQDLEITEEHHAALLALALYFEPELFKYLYRAPLLSEPTHNIPEVIVNKRIDLGKHFIVSAALKLLADNGVSDHISELKEILDSQSASGFSFTDIAANRAGIMFADLLTKEKIVATRVQQHTLYKNIKLDDFFPPFSHLDEGMTHPQFEQKYTNTASISYKKQMNQIDASILALRLYNL